VGPEHNHITLPAEGLRPSPGQPLSARRPAPQGRLRRRARAAGPQGARSLTRTPARTGWQRSGKAAVRPCRYALQKPERPQTAGHTLLTPARSFRDDLLVAIRLPIPTAFGSRCNGERVFRRGADSGARSHLGRGLWYMGTARLHVGAEADADAAATAMLPGTLTARAAARTTRRLHIRSSVPSPGVDNRTRPHAGPREWPGPGRTPAGCKRGQACPLWRSLPRKAPRLFSGNLAAR
jgi:hypothetical protein